MQAVAKVMRSGNSDVICVPSWWKRKQGISTGDYLSIVEREDGSLVLSLAEPKREKSFAERLTELRREVGDNEVMRDLTPEGVKEMLYGRD